MKPNRPLSVTLIALLYIVAGIAGLAYHASDWKSLRPFHQDIFWIALVRVLAIVCGAYMLRGQNWARWLALLWMALHVALSAFNPWPELAMHVAIFAVISFFLLRSTSSQYFRSPS